MQTPDLIARGRLRPRRAGIALLLVASAVLFGLVGPASVSAAPAADAVVAFTDTGINPYHEAFRDSSPRAYQHPSTYLAGFPADAQAVHLTLDAEDYTAAVTADCDTWRSLVPGELYWFPGTKVVGAISFAPPRAPSCTAPLILDQHGHGTMVASRGAATGYGACPTCRIVAVEFPPEIDPAAGSASSQAPIAAIRWVAANSHWIDVQSNSWGPYAPAWDATGTLGLMAASTELIQAVEETSRQQLSFWASGNGAAFRHGAAGHPTPLSPHLTPSAVVVGGHDSGFVTAWTGAPPHVVSDACHSWAARNRSLSSAGGSVGSGTSAATPFVAGGAAQILTRARAILADGSTGVDGGVVARGAAGLVPSGPLADGTFTLSEWKRLVLATATARPVAQPEDGPACTVTNPNYAPTPLQWSAVPQAYPEYLNIGYGAVDAVAVARAGRVLTGSAPLPDRSPTDAYSEIDHTVRTHLYDVYR